MEGGLKTRGRAWSTHVNDGGQLLAAAELAAVVVEGELGAEDVGAQFGHESLAGARQVRGVGRDDVIAGGALLALAAGQQKHLRRRRRRRRRRQIRLERLIGRAVPFCRRRVPGGGSRWGRGRGPCPCGRA